ncbi:MAG: type VI secretion system contractile sheath small subunit [Gammaproteobacteria bacterium]|nr:type VI secretion system contractile sheath small subunit [Gammaproteobacteria bacterium]MDH5727616.1 type VI secretion system contractile sheath small subunit [Gammaproteobacteria bacterium]
MMADGSVAPKERVNIMFKPATGGAQEEIELPLKLLMLGDYSCAEDERPLEDRKPIGVDKDNFNDVMRKQNLNLAFSVPNKLTGEEGDEMAVKLKMETLKDFAPDAIATQVPELNKLMELRNALTALKGPLGNVPAFRRKLEQMVLDDDTRQKMIAELGLDEKEKAE